MAPHRHRLPTVTALEVLRQVKKKNAVPPASAVPKEEAWREQYKDLI